MTLLDGSINAPTRSLDMVPSKEKEQAPEPPMPQLQSSDNSRSLKEFFINAFAGTVGGVCGVYVGNPLDVIKVRMQTGAIPSGSTIGGLRTLVSKEGPRALFAGALTSALGQAPNNAISFGSFGGVLNFLSNRRRTETCPPKLEPTLLELYLAGSTAGFLQTIALCPLEFIKVQQQVFQVERGAASAAHNHRPNMLEVAKGIHKRCGMLGFYRGWAATILRDAPTFGLYFVTYESVKILYHKFAKRRLNTKGTSMITGNNMASGSVPNNISEYTPTTPMWVLLLGGGLAGAVSWTFAVPADVLKSRIQAAALNTRYRDLRLSAVARDLYAESGYKGFVRGLVPCVLRSIPVNAVTFAGFEITLGFINRLLDSR